MRVYEVRGAPYFEDNPFRTLSRIDPVFTWFDSTADVIQFAFPIILSGIVSKIVLSRAVAEGAPAWMPLRSISVLIRLAGLLFFVGYNTIDSIDAWNEWESIYDVPPEPLARPTLKRFIAFDLIQYPPFIAASAFWLFHRDIIAAWRTGRRQRFDMT